MCRLKKFRAQNRENRFKIVMFSFKIANVLRKLGTGIRVTDLQPGDVKTNLIMNNDDLEAAEKVRRKFCNF